ncbi:MAG: hypothetical protein V2A34_11140 [Lentisphaerota bacterium]
MLKRKRKPVHRHPQHRTSNFSSALIYIAAVILAIALGALFYKGYKKAQVAMQKGTGNYSSQDLPPGAKVIPKSDAKPAAPAKKRPAEQVAPRSQSATPTAPEATASEPVQEPAPEPTPLPYRTTQENPAAQQKPIRPLDLFPRTTWQAVASDIPNPQTVTLHPLTNVAFEVRTGKPAALSGDLVIQANTHFILSRFDVSSIRGWTLRRVTWHGRVSKGRAREMGFSTVTADWDPRTGIFKGMPTDNFPGAPDLFRALDGKDYPLSPESVVFRGHGQSLFASAPAQPPDNAAGQWVTADIDPLILQAMIAGASYGMAISDESGQTEQPVTFASDGENQCYIEVEGGLSDVVPPGPIAEFLAEAPAALARLGSVGVVLNWKATGDDEQRGHAFRYDVRYSREDGGFDKALPLSRYRIPSPQPSGQADRMIVEGLEPVTTYYFYLRAVDESGQTGPVTSSKVATGNALILPTTPALENYDAAPIDVAAGQASFMVVDELSGMNPLTGQVIQSLKPLPEASSRRSFVWDRNTRTIHLRAFQNETAAFQIIFGRKSPTLPPLVIKMEAPLAGGAKNLALKSRFSFSRVWYGLTELATGTRAWVGDALVPLEGPLQMPWPGNAVPNQTHQAIYAELPVDADAEAGLYRGQLVITTPQGNRDTINVFLEVLNASLPAVSNFTCEWLSPPSLGSLYRKDISNAADLLPVETGLLALALKHRCQTLFFPYLPNGFCQPPFRPVSSMAAGECQIDLWSDWDARMGALQVLSPKMPFMLPVFENWPVPFEDGYLCFDKDIRVPGGFSVYGGASMEVEGCLHQNYRRAIRSALRQFGQHMEDKGWLGAPSYVWLNNLPSTNYLGRAPAWSFGRPEYLSDFTSLEVLAQIVQAEANTLPWSKGQLLFRISVPDISALRDLGGIHFQSLAVNDANPRGWRALRERASIYGNRLAYFCDSLPLSGQGINIEALGIRFFLEGADGWIIRDVAGRAENWVQAKPYSLVYCGTPFGENIPCASLRLKGLRRTLQDITLLGMLAEKKAWSRSQLADFTFNFMTSQKTGGFMPHDWQLLRNTAQQLILQQN